jgi:hypothetical protein
MTFCRGTGTPLRARKLDTRRRGSMAEVIQ